MSNSNCRTARSDLLEARRGALQDQLTASREQNAREAQQAREEIKKLKDEAAYQLQLAQEQGQRELKKKRDQVNELSNKITTLKVQNRIPVEPVQSSETKQINIPVGSVRVWHAPKPFKSVITGDTEIADVGVGETDADVVINAKKEGFTNFMLVDGEGIVLADIKLQVGYPLPLYQVRIYGRKGDISTYTSYQCPPEQNHLCYRKDEGTDRTPKTVTVVNAEGSVTSTTTHN
jgi:Flp pilus assembly secretin CpaC